jgi:hypothetical protein
MDRIKPSATVSSGSEYDVVDDDVWAKGVGALTVSIDIGTLDKLNESTE